MKLQFTISAALLAGIGAWAQSPVEAYTLSQTELRGTARFMSMGGAFTALGGDLSTLNQNPAGIGVYRGSELGFTLDVNAGKTEAQTPRMPNSWSKTHVDVNNVGYVGTFNIGSSVMQTFSWGFTYSRTKSFERQFRGHGIDLATSLSNYVALCSDGIDPLQISASNGANPYANTNYRWLSILAYNGGMITPTSQIDPITGDRVYNDIYDGLFQYPIRDAQGNLTDPGTSGTANFEVRQRGYVDEYSINFGGNLSNIVYWGLGIGITDMNFEENTSYVEELTNANVPNSSGEYIEPGNCDYELANWKRVHGAGVNVKLGLIFKPVQELRIGFAVHTPTYYSLNTLYNASVDFGASSGFTATAITDNANYDWNLRSPWRMMFGVAGVLGGRAIISADYEYQAFNKMKTSDFYGDLTDYNDMIATDFRNVNTLRLGAEFRVTPSFSVRAGYGLTTSGVTDDVADSQLEVITAGCNPAYEYASSTDRFSVGLGFRSGGFYCDLAYVYSRYKSDYHCFTSFEDYTGYWMPNPHATITNNSSQIVASIGYKF